MRSTLVVKPATFQLFSWLMTVGSGVATCQQCIYQHWWINKKYCATSYNTSVLSPAPDNNVKCWRMRCPTYKNGYYVSSIFTQVYQLFAFFKFWALSLIESGKYSCHSVMARLISPKQHCLKGEARLIKRSDKTGFCISLRRRRDAIAALVIEISFGDKL